MNIFLWILQGVLAFAFGFAGVLKMVQPIEKLKAQFPWIGRFPAATVRFIGALEFLGAVGLVVPWATGIATVLTPLAALGIAVLMILAIVHHFRNGEAKLTTINLVLLILAAVVAIGRF
jgi:uncharacterized membrane protein